MVPYDSISELPDHILHLIISLLPVKEAVKTSALSSRWKTLWCECFSLDFSGDFFVPALGFECCENRLCGGTMSHDFCGRIPFSYVDDETTKFLSRLKRLLELHQSPTSDEFRLHVDYRCVEICMEDDGSEDVMEWLMRYVFLKRVKRLDLNLLAFSESRGGRLSFNHRIGAIVGSAVPLTMKHLDCSMDFTCLKDVSLKGFDVSKEVIEHLLLRCQLLERITIIGTGILTDLVVSSSSLKYLNITFSVCIKIAKIWSCPNLHTLLLDNAPDLTVTGVPMLSELHVYQSCTTSSIGFSSHLSQLEVLMIHGLLQKRIVEFAEEIPELTRLRKLTINTGAWDDSESLIGLTSLISACPNLQMFILQIFWAYPSRSERKVERIEHPLKLPHLKVVEVSGYYGRTCEDELIMYLLENGVALEKIIVEPRSNTCVIGTPPFHRIEEENRARMCAARLLDSVPHHVKLILL